MRAPEEGDGSRLIGFRRFPLEPYLEVIPEREFRIECCPIWNN
jgi:hypothetical protein